MRESAEKEYYYLQSEIARYDQLSHGIKNWSITIGFALLAAGFAQKSPPLFLLASLAAATFWKTEARWKRLQRLHGKRIQEVECFLVGKSSEYIGPRVTGSLKDQFADYGRKFFSRTFRITKREFKVMLYANVQLPHNMIVLLGLVLYGLTWFSIIRL